MTEADAVQLIHTGVPGKPESSQWADLGSGNGTFTKALAQLLGKNSTILAIDLHNQRITSPNHSVNIQFLQADFTRTTLPSGLDGIVIANALHYVKDQLDFLTSLTTRLSATGRIILVEYDTDQANTWVPYPVPYTQLSRLLLKAGFKSVEKTGKRNSIYRQDKLYACTAIL